MFDLTVSEFLPQPYVRKLLPIIVALMVLNLQLGLLRCSLIARKQPPDAM